MALKDQFKEDAGVLLDVADFASIVSYVSKENPADAKTIPARISVMEQDAFSDRWNQNIKDTGIAYVRVSDVPDPKYRDIIREEDGTEWIIERIISRKVNIWGLSVRKDERATFK